MVAYHQSPKQIFLPTFPTLVNKSFCPPAYPFDCNADLNFSTLSSCVPGQSSGCLCASSLLRHVWSVVYILEIPQYSCHEYMFGAWYSFWGIKSIFGFRVSCDTPLCPLWTILYTQSVFSSFFPESAYFFDLIHKCLSNTLDVQEELTLWALFCFCSGNRLNFLMKSMSCLVVISVWAVFIKLVTRSRYLAIISK